MKPFPTSASGTFYLDETQPLEDRVDDLLSRLTFDEKIALTHADSKFTTPGVPRLGIPPMWLSDGPNGVREDIGPHDWKRAGRSDDYATYLPVLITLAATWNPELAKGHGEVIGAEALKRGKHVMLGPGVNIQRTPINGRNFEYMGEDPWLTSRMAVSLIKGIQSKEVAACVKHFALNNQEWERHKVDVAVDERALREIYLPAFEAAVKEAKVWTAMGAYNRVHGQWCCHNERLVNRILKGEWDFDGVYVSDWAGTHDTAQAALHGLDLEMGTPFENYDDYYLAKAYADGLEKGDFPIETLDDKVRRNLRLMFRTKVIGRPGEGVLNAEAHQAVARKIAEEGIVLLRNRDERLPLAAETLGDIAVIGDAATQRFARRGGSSEIKALYEKTALDGLMDLSRGRFDVHFSPGYLVREWTDAGEADVAGIVQGGREAGVGVSEAALMERAVAAAREASVAVIFATSSKVGFQDTEGGDRKEMRLPWNQDELIARVSAVNPKTIVVLYCGAPVEMPWIDDVAAVLHAWYPGMEGGAAIASILFGLVNPSGRLPCSFPKRLEDSPAHHSGDPLHYPGIKRKADEFFDLQYVEGIYVGYRWYDREQIPPLFPFGHGLSYTRFEYANGNVIDEDRLVVCCEVTNVGDRAGAEVVQVYVHDHQPSVDRPPQELKGFTKVWLEPGETTEIRIPLDPRAFAFFDEFLGVWRQEAGAFTLRIGASSRDIRLEVPYVLHSGGSL